MEHDPIGKGLARELMLCHKKVLNALPEGYFGTGPLCCPVECYTTLLVWIKYCRSYSELWLKKQDNK